MELKFCPGDLHLGINLLEKKITLRTPGEQWCFPTVAPGTIYLHFLKTRTETGTWKINTFL
jgi:hypothetical protein